MNEKKKGIIVLGIFVTLLILVLVLIFASLMKSNKKLKEFKNKLNSSEPQIIYIMKPTCYYCNLIEPITTKLKEKYKLNYYQIDSSKLSTSELRTMLNLLNVDLETFGTPYIAIVQNGKVIGEQSGYTDENVLFDLFKANGLIGENEELGLNYLDKDSLNNLWNSDSVNAVLIGESGDTSAIEARMNLIELKEEYSNVNISYFDISATSSDEEYSEWKERLEGDSLPVMVLIQNGKIIAKTKETTKEKYIQFFKENNYME